jgi:hypothetical protein
VQVYALTSTQLHETLDLFLTREAAETELREILRGSPIGKTYCESFRSSSMSGTCRRTNRFRHSARQLITRLGKGWPRSQTPLP